VGFLKRPRMHGGRAAPHTDRPIVTAAGSAFLSGFVLSAGLIVAIGAQNAFVLRQGLKREHVGAVVLFCAAADAALICAGVAGLGALVAAMPRLTTVVAVAGALFLAGYGVMAFGRAMRPEAMDLSYRRAYLMISLRYG